MWDPAAYLAFDDHRSRPFFDLCARIGAPAPRAVADLGCGPGHLTAALSRRWPDARVMATDSSPEMVAAARERGVDARLQDVHDFVVDADTDVVVCNAVLQWVPDHRELLRGWARQIPTHGWFAFQVPGNFGAASHRLTREVAASWPQLAEVGLRGTDAVAEPTEYARLLAACGLEVDAWETSYLQLLTGEDPVLRWLTGTALRPVRRALSDVDWARFTAELAPRLRAAYPSWPDGRTPFEFRRIFVVAHRDT
ncbi:MAG: trans-aconitate 2-methyltransferase [Sciscionella sp.]